MKIKELYEQARKIKPPIKPLKPISPVPPAKPANTLPSAKLQKILVKEFPANVSTGCPGLDEILLNLRSGVAPKDEQQKTKKNHTS